MKRNVLGMLAHRLFEATPVKDTCDYCGETSVGNGLFCDPSHEYCEIRTVCERHKQPIMDWSEVGSPVWGWEEV